MSKAAYPGSRPDRMQGQRIRDAALGRVSRVRAATIVAAGTVTAALAAFVSAAAPGHTLGAKVPVGSGNAHASGTTARSAARTMPPLASPRQLGLQSPDGAPQAAQAAPPAQAQPQPQPVSGGS